MAPEFASDLIRDMQIRLRRSAGVPSYDHGDPALSSVPSIDEAVVALDPSAPITSVAGDAMDAFREESTDDLHLLRGKSSAGGYHDVNVLQLHRRLP
ncbi:hypothetical protein HPP92_017994 [Vanilla planifolia]|uniref:Uncharacterized protein n=1 Tax=Vanilla planifolia TaxID=51239 RepID=A0A835Q8Z9_VANPL|nr:hypothetical protein HPP92_017994 [Vanilla planifolia]